MKIDAHQHFWNYDPVRDAWIDDSMVRLRENFLPPDLEPLLSASGIDGCVAVQADQSEKETHFLLKLADENSFIKGVVGWIDLLDYGLENRLESFSQFPRLKGFRHLLQGENDSFFRDSRLVEGITRLKDHDFSYDILIYENQLSLALELVQSLPVMKLVIDHIAKPDIKNSSFDNWSRFMNMLSEFDHVHVKLSGMVTEADWKTQNADDLLPYLDHCFECFGAGRLMFGSDWPVCLLAAEYDEVAEIIENYVSSLSENEQELIMGKTAMDFYSL